MIVAYTRLDSPNVCDTEDVLIREEAKDSFAVERRHNRLPFVKVRRDNLRDAEKIYDSLLEDEQTAC